MNVSYAQNYEDIIIWRLFKQNAQPGFYLDVGAAHPTKDSVSQFFSARGWRGMNIEPNTEYFDLLKKARPQDINVWCAVADFEGEAVFNFVENDPKLSSLENLAPELIQKHDLKLVKKTVPVRTLRNLISEHNIQHIDFFKVDAEGAEQKVLAGFPFDRIKPRLIIMEAVEAKSDVSTTHLWEPILNSNSYSRAYFDGINTYYVQNTDVEAQKILRPPLNATDDFLKYEHSTFKYFFKNFIRRSRR